MHRLSRFIPLLLPLLSGCDQQVEDLLEIDDVRYRAEYAIPLVDSEVNLSDLVGEVAEGFSLTVDPDGLLRFQYSGEVPAVGSDVIFAQLDPLSEEIFLPIIDNEQSVPFALADDIRLEELRMKRGELTFDLPSRYNFPVTITFGLPAAKSNGVPLELSQQLPAYSGEGDPPRFTNVDAPIKLEDYILDLDSDSLFIEVRVEGPDGRQFRPSRGSAAVFRDLRFEYVSGYLGRAVYPGEQDTIEIDFFDDYRSGEINFIDPVIRFTLQNSFGVPARAVVDRLNIITQDGDVLPVTGSAIDNGFDFDYPREPGEIATTVFEFNAENSNLPAVIGSRPAAVDVKLSAIINPDADTTIVGFLTDTSAYSARVDVELPLFGSASDFALSDTFAIDLDGEFDALTNVELRITTDNSLPFALQLEGIFFDGEGRALLDLADGAITIIEAAPVGADGNPTGTTSATNDILFSNERAERLREAEQLVITTTFGTTNGGSVPVRINREQLLRIRIGAKLTVERQ